MEKNGYYVQMSYSLLIFCLEKGKCLTYLCSLLKVNKCVIHDFILFLLSFLYWFPIVVCCFCPYFPCLFLSIYFWISVNAHVYLTAKAYIYLQIKLTTSLLILAAQHEMFRGSFHANSSYNIHLKPSLFQGFKFV